MTTCLELCQHFERWRTS